MRSIPYSHQSINYKDIDNVIDVLQSDWLTQGNMVPEFENIVAEYCGVKYAVAVNSGTSALHLACLVLGVESGDTVWTTPMTFVATANAPIMCGASIDFVDIDPVTGNMNVDLLEEKLQKASLNGSLPQVVIPVHYAGQSCQMHRIFGLSDKYGFFILEDASHALGGSYLGYKVGSCKFSHMATFSFHPVKSITTGEGGMVLTNYEYMMKEIRKFREHGIIRDSFLSRSHGPWYYEQVDLGYNYRMTDIQAALGISQMGKLDSFMDRRMGIVKRYKEGLLDIPNISFLKSYHHVDPANHLFVIKVRPNHDSLYKYLHGKGIRVGVHYIPVHTHPYYSNLGFKSNYLPMSNVFYHSVLSLPLFPDMREDEQSFVIEQVKRGVSYA